MKLDEMCDRMSKIQKTAAQALNEWNRHWGEFRDAIKLEQETLFAAQQALFDQGHKLAELEKAAKEYPDPVKLKEQIDRLEQLQTQRNQWLSGLHLLPAEVRVLRSLMEGYWITETSVMTACHDAGLPLVQAQNMVKELQKVFVYATEQHQQQQTVSMEFIFCPPARYNELIDKEKKLAELEAKVASLKDRLGGLGFVAAGI